MRKITRLDSPSAITAISDHFSSEIVEHNEIEQVLLLPNGQAVEAHFSHLYPTFCLEAALLNYVTPKLVTPLLMTPIFFKLTMARLKQQLAAVNLPEVAVAYDLLMELASLERQLELATGLLHRGIKLILDPITQNALLLQGWLALQYGQLARSQILLEALLKMAPDDYQARKMLIVVLLKLELPEQVLTHCAKLKNANINEAELWLCESQAYLMMEQQEKAQQAYHNYLLWKSN